MIDKLKKKFIILAMLSLTILLSAIVAGMNIINYNSVVDEADDMLAVLSQNNGRMPIYFDDEMSDVIEKMFEYGEYDEDTDDAGEIEDLDDEGEIEDLDDESGASSANSSKRAKLPQWMTRDRAEETRYFSVLVDSSGSTINAYLDRIYAVDEETAKTYAEAAIRSNKSSGFIEDYRYISCNDKYGTRITFVDCGRILDQFRSFLYTSILMSLVGLAVVFAAVWYFAGRIVKPVAESYEKQKRFITDAGHEIKTPLTIIKANIDVMKMDLEDEDPDSSLASDMNESLDDIVGQVDRLTTLTNNLVYLSRMEEAGNTLAMTEVPISDIVSETADSFKAVAQERGKVLDVNVVPMLSMKGSNKELEKLVSILVENALKYSVPHGSVEVSLKKEGRNVELEVRNRTPEPIDGADLEHVFERFYRADKSRNSAIGGHGIGLSMAHAIVAAHGGKIRATNGDGCEFIVTATMPAE